MAIVASAQITLVNLSDARSLQALISSSQPMVQIYDVDTNSFIPNWALMPPTLTPSMYVSGSQADIIQEALLVEWYKDGVLITEDTSNHQIGSGYKLTIGENVLEYQDFVTYTLIVTYYDTKTGLTITDSENIEFAKVRNGTEGESSQTAYLLFPDGTVFKNDKPTDKKRLEVRYFDGIYEQFNNLTVKWFYADPNVEIGDPNYDADAGKGWSKISHTNDANGSYTNYTTKIMSVSRNGVDGTETFRALVKSGNKPFYSALGTLVDIFDPHQVVIEGDSVFKNGVGTLQLKARVFLDSEEIEDLSGYSFIWTAYNSDGEEIDTFMRTSQEITISSSDVPPKGYLACDIYQI